MSPIGSGPREWKAIDRSTRRRLWKRVQQKLVELGVDEEKGQDLVRKYLNDLGFESTGHLTPVTYETLCNLVDHWTNDTFQPTDEPPPSEEM